MKKIKTLHKLWKSNRVTTKKLINLAKIRTSILLKTKKIYGYPYILIIEPTNLCNLKCPTCPTGNGSLKRKRGILSFENYKKVIDECGEYLMSIVLMNYGEPLLNKDFYKMVEYAHKKNIFVTTCTNGHLIDPKKMVDSKIDELTIGIDGTDQKTLASFRKGANFKKIKENIKKLVKEKELQKTKSPVINLQYIIMKHNEHQINEFRRLAKEWGVDKITFKALWVTSKEEAESYLPENKEFHRYILKNKEFKLKNIENYKCQKPWTDIAINWDGSLVICACDFDNSIILGNINEKSVKEIIKSKKAQTVRKTIINNRRSIPVCKNCAPNSDISITEKLK